MKLIDVVRKLTGPVSFGETNIDTDRYDNLRTRIELMKELHQEIMLIADTGDPQIYSEDQVMKLVEQYRDWLISDLGFDDCH